MEIKRPVFHHTEKNDKIYTEYSHIPPLGRLEAAFAADTDTGEYRMDRVLARRGELNGDPEHGGIHDGDALMTRGRALYMYTHDPSVLGFGGTASYCQPVGGTLLSIRLYDIGDDLPRPEDIRSSLHSGGEREFPHPDSDSALPLSDTGSSCIGRTHENELLLTEIKEKRINAPSHWHGEYKSSVFYVTADKFITEQNCAVLLYKIENRGGEDAELAVVTSSTFACEKYAVYPDNIEQGELRLRFRSPGDLTVITARMTASGAHRPHRDETELSTHFPIGAGAQVNGYALISFTTEEIPGSTADYLRFASLAKTFEDALLTQKREYNEYWHKTVPYIDTPSSSVNLAIDYRHWLERFNTLDADIPGYDYQYPITIEGVLGYNNAIVLTQCMHLDDTKWHRTARIPYGQLLSVCACSGGSAFLDNPGNRGAWNDHYGQYIAAAGRDAFYVHGGDRELALYLARAFEGDAKGQLEHYGNHESTVTPPPKLIAYRSNYMTGNDADTVSMHYPGVGEYKMHAENAYVYGAAAASAEMYALAGENDKSRELSSLADEIRADILKYLWCDKCHTFETRAVLPGEDFIVHNDNKPNLVPHKESNCYNYFALGVPPTDDSSLDDSSLSEFREAFRHLADPDEFPVFPYYTASQRDNAVCPGSNNFSNINFTVQARAYEAALRTYDREHKYVTPEMLASMVEWCAWCVFPDGGDVRYPNNNEFFNADRAEDPCGKGDFYRSWIYHNILGNYIYIFIEDMAGIRPRADGKIELDPIDFGYTHFAVDNLRYHGRDLSIFYNADSAYADIPPGYSLYLDGSRVLTVDAPTRLIYDPVTGSADTEAKVLFSAPGGAIYPALGVGQDDETVRLLTKAGLTGENLAFGSRVEASYTPDRARVTPWAEKHRADGNDPTSRAVNEPVPVPAAVTDGSTVCMPFWGNHGSENEYDTLTLTLSGPVTFDTLAVYFYCDRQPGGYSHPRRYLIEYFADDGWHAVTTRSQEPRYMCAGRNVSRFDAVTSDRVRVHFYNRPGHPTAVTEIQLFFEGTRRRAVMNHPPLMYAHSRDIGGLSAALSVEIVDDGMPFDSDLACHWYVDSAPEGASFSIDDPTSPETMMTVSVSGHYRVTLRCTDGETRRNCTHDIEISD